ANKQAIVEGDASHIVGSSLFTGVFGNYLRASVAAAGLDPDNLPSGDVKTMNFASGEGSKAKAWRDIWGSGQGIGAVKSVQPAAELVARLKREYAEAKKRICASP
ncbi:MAG: nitronate monooxygenase, partial [Roseiarcus sp.]